MRRRRSLLVWACLLVLPSCAAYKVVDRTGPTDLGWPSDHPRVRLQRVIDLHGQLGRGPLKFLGWLGDKREAFLFERPYALAWEGEALWIADPGAGRVARIGPRDRIKLSPAGVFTQPIGIAACPQGIVVSDAAAGKVGLVDDELRLVEWLAEGFSRPTGVACRGERIFVVETAEHRVRVREADGSWGHVGRRGAGAGEFNFPTAVAVDGTTVLVGDTLNFRLQRFDVESGLPVGSFGRLGDAPGEMPRIKGVAVDVSGHVWVSDAHLDHVSLYDAKGNVLISIGRPGRGAGEFSFPAGIAAHPDGRVAVADSLNRRVQIFEVLKNGSPSGA